MAAPWPPLIATYQVKLKTQRTLGTSLNKTQLSARLALIVAPIGLGWSLSETNPLNAYLWLSALPLLALAITLTLPADSIVKLDADKEVKGQTNNSNRTSNTEARSQSLLGIRCTVLLCFFLWSSPSPISHLLCSNTGVTNQAWIGFLYALPHGVYLLFAGKIHLFSEWLNRRHPQNTLYLGFGLLSVSTAMHLIPDQTTLIIARVVFGLGMVCCYQGLHQALANQIDRQQSGKIFSRFDAMSKWGGVAAGLSASFISSLGWLEVPFLLSTLISFSTAIAMIILSKFGHRHVKHSFISN